MRPRLQRTWARDGSCQAWPLLASLASAVISPRGGIAIVSAAANQTPRWVVPEQTGADQRLPDCPFRQEGA
ncbi:hypothetical protein RRF57_000589 [Xylaria bambusicola]|uniref:Uncharacterized protein n=1 Tax=Xylaria bambusicola TaxID=326684 RepID=A0AAN7UAZ1_9PEZI